MLTIRLNRTGKRNKAYFRVVLQEHTVAPGGRHIEVLGSYDPHSKKAALQAEKIKDWVKKGAQVSDSAYNLFIKEGVLGGKKRAVKIPKPQTDADKTQTSAEKEIKDNKLEEKKSEEAPKKEAKTEEKVEEKKTEAKPEEHKTEEVVDKKQD